MLTSSKTDKTLKYQNVLSRPSPGISANIYNTELMHSSWDKVCLNGDTFVEIGN